MNVTVQAVYAPTDETAAEAAQEFKKNAESYWNAQQLMGPDGEEITFNVSVIPVAADQVDNSQDKMMIVNGSGVARVNLHGAARPQ
ncbi:MAG TPA: hypothetical protein VF846_01760 [Thermoanaerobaculia bacterium]